MVKILYDFDIGKINNSRFFNPITRNVDKLSTEFTSNLLKYNESLLTYQYLGGGYDSVCFIESTNQKFYIVEPANGLIIAHDLIDGLLRLEYKRRNINTNFEFSFGSLMDETIFRSHRNDDEFFVIGKIKNFSDINKNEVILNYPNSTFEWKCKYIEFVPELLRFGEQMMQLYDSLLPDFKEYVLYPKLKEMLLGDNLLRQNYGHLLEFDNLGKSFLDYISPPSDERIII